MFIKLNHKSLEIYEVIREMIKEVYKLSLLLPPEERFNMTSQLRRAALSVKLNFSEGCARKSLMEKRRFFEVSRSSLVEVDSVFETATDLKYFQKEELETCGKLINKTFAMLSGMIK